MSTINSHKEKAIQYIHNLLMWMTKNDASDLFVMAGFPPAIKVHGALMPVPDAPKIIPEQAQLLVTSIMNSQQYGEYEKTKECNFAISIPQIGRFRVNALQQRTSAGMVIRIIKTNIQTLEELNVPSSLGELIMAKRGLLIMVGATGSGKSTTLSAMIDYRNTYSKGHIITIEDPIEFTHNHKNCIVTQREVGVDTETWGAALKNTLRQAPDVIYMGEIRTRETMEYALQFAETGHLCVATLHANNANQAIDRVLNFFPEERRTQTLMDLGMNLRAFISQRLIPKIGGGRIPAVEILINTPLVTEKILKGETSDLKDLMRKSKESGMITFDDYLYQLHKQKLITFEDGYRNADSANEFRLKVKLDSSGIGEDSNIGSSADTVAPETKLELKILG